ncbi:MAG: glycosyltransferase family 4 protein [Anaerolineae bacterium]|nr:glycosyltransferase family 4 protein [Anaerolineae bacterium]
MRRYFLDARTAVTHFPGIGRYVSSLAQALVPLLYDDEQLVLLYNPQEPSQWQLPPENEKVQWLKTAVSPFSLTQQTRIPSLLKGAALYHSPYYLMPYRPGVPTVLTVYDLIPQRYPQYVSAKARLLTNLTTKLALRTADHIIAISEATRQDFIEAYHVDFGRITVVPLAPAPTFKPQSPATRPPCNLATPYVLYLGINKPHKNLPKLIRAWKIVQDQTANPAILVIAGAWDNRYPEAKELAKELNVTEAVTFLGAVSDEDLPALYAGADLFIFPSYYEGFGLPVIEAMACGTAVACSHTSSLPEVGGNAAVYFNPHDPQDIAHTLIHLLQNEDERRSRQQQSLQQARQFTWQNTAQATLNIYRHICP